MSEWLFYFLAGSGAISWIAVTISAINSVVNQRRQDALAAKLAALRFSEISPADAIFARSQWPANYERARRLGEERGRHGN